MSKKIIIGKEEWCSLMELGLPAIKARVDSGAKTSALHAFDIQEFYEGDQHFVRFEIHPFQRSLKGIRSCVGRVVDQREVKSSSGQKQNRLVIKTPITMGEETWDIELTLTNRDSMGYRMLLGREAMKDRVLIDPDASFCLGKISKKELKSLYQIRAARRKK